MSDNKLTELQQLRKDIAEDTKKIVEASEKKLIKKIDDSQKDTIEVLMDAIHTGYNMHDKRIKRAENELGLPPIKQ